MKHSDGMDFREILEKLRNSGELPSETQVTRACDKVIELLSHESTVLSIDAPVTIVGDVHGQFYDVLEIFRVNGELPHANYLFLGDYVDRGYYSLETLLYLILLKIVYPNRVFLIRGNHESVQITQVYGFYDECLRSYETPFVYNKCVAVFEMLPLSAVVNNDTFTVHGGLSPRITKVDEIREISRPCDVPLVGTVLDLLWSDPEEDITEWSASPRGAGFLFGKRPAEYFCKVNGFKSIVRAHQLVMEGYKHHFDKLCVTVWSAPNYCYRCGNIASIYNVDEGGSTSFTLFEAAAQEKRAPIPADFNVGKYFL